MDLQKISEFLKKPAVRYIAPFVCFMIFTTLESYVNGRVIFVVYALKTLSTGLLIFLLFRNHKEEITGHISFGSVGLGLLILGLWLLPDFFADHSSDLQFDPSLLQNRLELIFGILFRVLGAALIVPIMEELLWRSFLMRFLIKEDFLSVKVGEYTRFSFWITVLAFTSVHAMWEWPAAFVAGILFGGYVVKTKNLIGCIVAHAVANLGLAIYILTTGKYYFW